jgi:hypothetical protein
MGDPGWSFQGISKVFSFRPEGYIHHADQDPNILDAFPGEILQLDEPQASPWLGDLEGNVSNY